MTARWSTRRARAGSGNHNAKLTEAEVLEIRRRAAGGEAYRALARAFLVSRSNIGHIVSRRQWRHI